MRHGRLGDFFFKDKFTETCVCVLHKQTKNVTNKITIFKDSTPPQTAPFVAESVWVEVAPGRVVETKN